MTKVTKEKLHQFLDTSISQFPDSIINQYLEIYADEPSILQNEEVDFLLNNHVTKKQVIDKAKLLQRPILGVIPDVKEFVFIAMKQLFEEKRITLEDESDIESLDRQYGLDLFPEIGNGPTQLQLQSSNDDVKLVSGVPFLNTKGIERSRG